MPEQLIYESSSSKVYLTEDEKSPTGKAIIKEHKQSSDAISKLINQYELLKEIEVSGVYRVLYCEPTSMRPHIAFEYAEGKSLRELLTENGAFSTEEFLELARQLCQTLGEIHNAGIIHCDISPGNIIWNPQLQKATLIDFDTSRSIRQRGTGDQLKAIEPGGTLRYISPEQTGRVNRKTDFRSDLYSTGMVFYELLAGHAAFPLEDAGELIYAHLARPPEPLIHTANTVPEPIARVVMKMIEKSPELRYQSAFGLLHDLQEITNQFKSISSLSTFEPGLQDYSRQLQLSQRLFGREEEVEKLKENYHKAESGESRLVMIEGSPGVGKSALINELTASVYSGDNLVLTGGFDQYRRNIPYDGWIQVFGHLVNRILSEDQEELERWKRRMQDSFGDQARIMTDLIPGLDLVLGEQPQAEELTGSESRMRFTFLLQNLMDTLCKSGKTVVIVLDDLQWADQSSMELLELILSNRELHGLLLVLSFRPPDEDDSGVFKSHSERLRENFAHDYLVPGNLKENDIKDLLIASLHPPGKEIEQLPPLIFEKTRGNAFYVRQFLETIYDKGLLFFDHNAVCWRCIPDQIKALEVTENVVDLVAHRLEELGEKSVDVLKTASVIGSEFDLPTLKQLSGLDKEVHYYLQKPIMEGFVEPLESNGSGQKYRFSHDRIYQVVYEQNTDEERRQLHYQISGTLLKHLSQEQWYDQAFTLASHLNEAGDLVTDQDLKNKRVQLNRMAGLKARANNAYPLAVDRLERAWYENPGDDEQQFRLLMELIETCFLNASFDKARDYLEIARKKVQNNDQQIQLLFLEIRFAKAENDFGRAITVGNKALDLLGEKLPDNPGNAAIIWNILITRFAIGRKRPADMLKLPSLQAEEKRKALQILNELGLPAYLTNSNLLPIIMLKAIRIFLRHGITEHAVHDFNIYGFLQGQMGSFTAMIEYALMSRKLGNQMDVSKAIESKAVITFNGLTRHWFEHPSKCIPDYLRGYEMGRESGNTESVLTSLCLQWDHMFFEGRNLSELKEIARDNCNVLAPIDQKQGVNFFEYAESYLNSLIHPSRTFSFDPTIEYQRFSELDTVADFCKFATLSALRSWITGDYDRALELIHKVEENPIAIAGLIYSVQYRFIKALICIELIRKDKRGESRNAVRELKKLEKEFKKYSKFHEDNFRHYHLLAQGGVKLSRNQTIEAAKFFAEAVFIASENNFPLAQALIAWTAARTYRDFGDDARQQLYLKTANQLFHHWEFRLATHYLEQEITPEPEFPEDEVEGSSSSSTITENLDLNTVVKTLETIAGEIEFSRIIGNLLNILVENAGAESGVLILDKDQQWLDENGAEGVALTLLSMVEVENAADRIASSAVRYSMRTGETVLLDHAAESEQFSSDEYLAGNQIKSLMCIPLVNQGTINGLLYLENNLTEGAFRGERVELIRLLSKQLSIAVENAYLYDHLEKRVEERTSALSERNKKLEEANEEIRRQHGEVQKARDELEKTIDELKSTQQQLIQQEKMASLGELTAGIAHEIKNPLNFINNFSEVTKDLVEELRDEIRSLQSDHEESTDDVLSEILNDIVTNIDTIYRHGSRADDIVKGMLQHSRGAEGQFEETDINNLVDEYADLAYHGLRAKLPSFNAEIIKSFDERVGKLNVVPQDLSRAVLNIINNGLQAGWEAAQKEGGGGLAKLEVRTLKHEDEAEIQIEDNGAGIPDDIREKIFQPFFTTKSTGEGTGLGLSMAFDIIKAHNGKLEVETEDGKGTKFRIVLPDG